MAKLMLVFEDQEGKTKIYAEGDIPTTEDESQWTLAQRVANQVAHLTSVIVLEAGGYWDEPVGQLH